MAMFPVSVIMERRLVSGNRWISHQWVAAAVTAGAPAEDLSVRRIFEDQEVLQQLYPGLRIRLYVDECESYYHNLLAERPRCYVVTRTDMAQIPVPLLVSMSFDEAHAYMEGDDDVHPVDMPPELYRWTESFVLTNYVPTKRTKRRRQAWRSERDRA